MSDKAPSLPPAGDNRFWVITHQPNKKTTPLRIELRERLVKDSTRNSPKLSRLITFEDTVADSEQIYNKAVQCVIRAGHMDRFIGVWDGEPE